MVHDQVELENVVLQTTLSLMATSDTEASEYRARADGSLQRLLLLTDKVFLGDGFSGVSESSSLEVPRRALI